MTKQFCGYLLITNVPPEVWRAGISGDPQVIGRSDECEIVIPGNYRQVSRRHATIECWQKNLQIQDIGSTGGTKLNGVPLIPNKRSQLVIGDRVWLGGLELHYISTDGSILEGIEGKSSNAERSSDEILSIQLPPARSAVNDRLKYLSPAELDVLHWICRGLMTNKEIALRLDRSPNTIRTQLGSIFQKLDLHSREQLITLLRRHEIGSLKFSNIGEPFETDLSLSVTDELMQTPLRSEDGPAE
jgi:DNA-binding CsgD family transcriptional regulator